MPFIHAISASCNSYFCWGFFRMMENKKYGTTTNALTVWKDYMVSMGFGYRLGIDLPGEQRGLIPNAAYYDKIYGQGRWTGLRTIHTAIGQGEILLTPVQIANLAATIANRGYYITPHIVRQIEDNEMDSIYTTPHYTMIDPQNYEYIVEGMRGAVIGSPYGSTCYRANIPGIEVCGKTGTAQNRGKDHSVFMGFAPMNNPQIAVSVYVENAGYGATWAVPTAALLIEKYINGFIAAERAYQIDNISNTNLIPHGIQKH
ncbi:Penicillin-binding protein 2 [termite gut metagenome]|uniref:Penicillin-binding protein 2 n=1 Tax=termite gut metagenome TaxID=433724 RepID=A0A5J4S961_9ZZZZ